jgi:multiple sugar transport system ATP-binding protein
MPSIEVKNVSKSFGPRTHVLQNVSFEVPDCTFFTLLGPSGCGKTTLLRIIAGLEMPDEGSIAVGGKDITSLAPAKRNISMVFQSYALYPHLTVFKNIATPLRLRNAPEDEIGSRVQEAAELLDITEHLHKRPGVLSGGERQRVALARAIVREPDVFLMDEPLSNLDALLRERMRTELKMLFERIGATVIYVTHDQVEAMAMSDVVAVLHEGQIQQAGQPQQIYDTPANEYVAGFVGSPRMNFLKVRVQDDALAFESGRRVPIPDRFRKGLSDLPEAATLGFRPEDVRFSEPGLRFAGEVLAVETLGPQSVILANTREGEMRALARADRPSKAASISLFVPEEKVHLFSHPGGEAWQTGG